MVTASKILVVDDEAVVNESCRRVLSKQGYEVHTTERGRDGLDRASSQDFDLVITDLKMPDLDGMDLVRELRGKRPELAIVVITGYGTIPSAVEAVQLGVSDYLEKPFTPEQLKDAVRRALPADEQAPKVEIDVQAVRDILRMASTDPAFAERLRTDGTRVLTGLSLSPQAKAAILSGDIAWIERQCGELSAEERDWLERRLQAEIW